MTSSWLRFTVSQTSRGTSAAAVSTSFAASNLNLVNILPVLPVLRLEQPRIVYWHVQNTIWHENSDGIWHHWFHVKQIVTCNSSIICGKNFMYSITVMSHAWVSLCFKSLSIDCLFSILLRLTLKKTIKPRIAGPFILESIRDQWFPSQGVNNVEIIAIPWRHYPRWSLHLQNLD